MKTLYLTLVLIITLAAGIGSGWLLRENLISQYVTVEVEVDDITGWELLQMAIIMTESDFNSQAIGKHNDIGVFQITPIYVKEVNRLLDTARFHHTDAFDVSKSVQMFNIVQDERNPEHDIETAISLHNPGGESIGYTEKVLKNFRWLSQLEEVRKEVVK